MDQNDVIPEPKRPAFTAAQSLQAEYVGHVSDRERNKRRPMPTYPIDNVSREIVSDRDDGVYVEAEPAGSGFRVHVTIADVAAHVRAGSTLATAAWQRAFTVYGPGWTDPMFPKILEENLSLEHNKERLGMTVSITLDKNFRPIHTNFTPVLTTPDNSSYQEAQERMLKDPQFQLMSDIALGIRRNYLSAHGEIWDELFDMRAGRNRSGQQTAAQEMVATYMLLANSCVAEFFQKSGLPFLYRNFDTTQNDTHAHYGTQPLKHTALEKVGLKGAYCHFTSPIRRAPDYFDGLIVHYAVDVLDDVQQRLQEQFPIEDPKKLHKCIWAHGPEILKLLGDTDTQLQAVRNKSLRGEFTQILKESSVSWVSPPEHALMSFVRDLRFPPPPVSVEELDRYAAHINGLSHSPQMREIGKLNEKYETNLERMDQIADASAEVLTRLTPEKFSSLLQAAAQTGDMPRKLFDETLDRLKTGKLDRTQDYFSIFVRAQHPGVPRWIALKREVARSVKHDPSLVNTLYGKLENYLKPGRVELKTLPMPAGKAEGEAEPVNITGALVAYEDKDGQRFASPFYSVGHNIRAAKSHALYSFLENYAFGQLQPVAQTAVPNLLYAELEVESGVAKHELLSRMVEDMGATLNIQQSATEQGQLVHITVQGGELPTPIVVDADAANATDAMQSALRRILSNKSFKTAASRNEPSNLSETLNPHEILEDLVTGRGGKIDFRTPTKDQRGNNMHRVEVAITVNGKETLYNGTGPNIDRAKRVASIKALEAMGWAMEQTPLPAKSWVTDAGAKPNDDKRFFSPG